MYAQFYGINKLMENIWKNRGLLNKVKQHHYVLKSNPQFPRQVYHELVNTLRIMRGTQQQ